LENNDTNINYYFAYFNLILSVLLIITYVVLVVLFVDSKVIS